MRLLVCGSRHWTAEAPIVDQLAALRPDAVIHGAAAGADTIAEAACWVRGIPVERFPADWAQDGRAAGPIRNERMRREGKPDRGLAFGALWRRGGAAPLWKCTGTGDMVRRMLDAGLPVRWVRDPEDQAVDLVTFPAPPRSP